MMNPEWILDDNTAVKVFGIKRMIIPASDVEMVEFEESLDRIRELTSEIEASAAKMLEHKSDEMEDDTVTKETSDD